MIKALIAHGNPIMLLGLRCVLAQATDTIVVAETAELAKLLEQARTTKPDVVILDAALSLANEGGYGEAVTATESVAELYRAGVRGILVLQACPDEETFFRFLMSGAAAYVPPTTTSADLLSMIRRVACGEYLMSSDVLTWRQAWPSYRTRARAELVQWLAEQEALPSAQLSADLLSAQDRYNISPREVHILQLMEQGASNEHIAATLGLGFNSTKNAITSLFGKLGASCRTGAVVQALKCRIIRLTKPCEESEQAEPNAQEPWRENATSGATVPLLAEQAVLAELGELEPNLRAISDREIQVLQVVATGASYEEVAQVLGIRAKTVQAHMSAVMHKLGVHGRRRQGPAIARALGLVPRVFPGAPSAVSGKKEIGAMPESGQATRHTRRPDLSSLPPEHVVVAQVSRQTSLFQGGAAW